MQERCSPYPQLRMLRYARLSVGCGMFFSSGQLHTQTTGQCNVPWGSAPHPGQRPYTQTAVADKETQRFRWSAERPGWVVSRRCSDPVVEIRILSW